ncbi:unnamed protein product [Thelazia callipaeda]|uniref:Trimethylguanosine synthase n=1 Tax=Thelazia callipaeda TaxID=103827 RepID=A0A3P7N1L2_THECL|nr:unnamed protein product [Thelazia callipaeda]
MYQKYEQLVKKRSYQDSLLEFNPDENLPLFRYDWNLYGEAVFYFKATAHLPSQEAFCCFSRAELKDGRLARLRDKPRETNAHNSHVSGSEFIADMAALKLPISFEHCNCKKRNSSRKKRSEYNIREKSPYFKSSVAYKSRNGMYLERKSWSHDYPESFSTLEDAKYFDYSTETLYAPYGLLKDHENAEAFFGISYSHMDHTYEECSGCWFHQKPEFKYEEIKDSSAGVQQLEPTSSQRTSSAEVIFNWDELYSKHSEAVDRLITKDYMKYEKESPLRRCKEFSEKLISVGLTYNDECASNVEDVDASTSGLTKGGGYHICDIHYDFRIPNRFMQVNSKIYGDVEVDNGGDNTNDCDAGDQLNTSSSRNTGIEDVDFSYDEQRDKWLVAKNALDIFKSDKDMPKYYSQRFRLFSRLNEGILMDRGQFFFFIHFLHLNDLKKIAEGWYSVTPEVIAAHIADRVVIMKDIIVLDGFAGVGGNCIQFALKGAYVIALDMDHVRLRCAKRNAEIYGVADRIDFICTDFFNFCKFHSHTLRRSKLNMGKKRTNMTPSTRCDKSKLWRNKNKTVGNCKLVEENAKDKLEVVDLMTNDMTTSREANEHDGYDSGIIALNVPVIDAILLSPPWGGPSYLKSKVFSLNDMEPKGDTTFRVARDLSHNIAYYLPRQTNTKELITLSKKTGGIVEIEQAVVNKKVKAITAYFGNLACQATW